MRFAALGGSNVGDYAAAGKAVADSAAKTFAVQRKTGPDYGEISKVAMVTAAEERMSSMKAAAQVAKAGINAYETNVKQGNKIAVFNKEQDIKTKQKMAGGIAAIGKLAAVGVLSKDNDKGREYPGRGDAYTSLIEKNKATKAEIETRRTAASAGLTTKPTSSQGGTEPGKATTGDSDSPASTPLGSSLSGNQKFVADAIAKYESGDWGYEAFNQGGAKGGTEVLGKSGSYKQTYGRSLTDMTLGEIYHKQNTEERGLSMDEHIRSGGLHAVGRYQFIGPTLQEEARRMGLSPDTKFTPEVQDSIWLSHIKRVGNISPWVGPSNNYNASQKAEFNSMISQF